MPTITLSDLKYLIEESSYKQYSRESRGFENNLHYSTHRRLRPQTAPKTRFSNKSLWNDEQNVVPRTYLRTQSAKSNYSHNNDKDLDYTGLSNMMKGLQIKQSRQWRPKPNTVNRNASEKDINPKINNTCNNKASNISKVRNQVQHFFKTPLHTRLHLEGSVPSCLRKTSRYVNSPVRQHCIYDPPVRAVTRVKLHSLSSSSLPGLKPHKHVKEKRENQMSQSTSLDLQEHNENISCNSYDLDDRERNGSYHYVYEGETPMLSIDAVTDAPVEIHAGQELKEELEIKNTNSDLNNQENVSEAKSDNTEGYLDDLYGQLLNDLDADISEDGILAENHEGRETGRSTRYCEPLSRPIEHFNEKTFSPDEVDSEIEENISENIEFKPISFTRSRVK